MTISHETVLFDVNDCRVYPLQTDLAGQAPVYGVGVDVPGIAEVSVDPNFVTAELKGDARVIAKKGRIDRFNFSGKYGKLSADALAVLLGQGAQTTDIAAITATSLSAVSSTGKVITGTGFTAALEGRAVTGAGVAAGTYINDVTSATTATLNVAPSPALSSASLTVAAAPEEARMRMKSPAPLGYFRIEFKIEDLDEGIGDLHVIIYKAQLTGGTLLGTSSDNFGQPSFDAEGIALTGDLGSTVGGGTVDTGVMVDWRLLGTVLDLTA